ncbi:serine protease inhibitor dipetalogastin-like [Mytilus californianus]|uniref:serine protease inhibitor dipetalogastin-like n=1 Tax=Mytilus californianus TaxID=6549 RepID=UPI00224638A5|nr:serine protease inhibitor dipetalogastin-like [Mytilus californianus]
MCNKRCPCDCKDHCPYTYSPVCGKDGKTHQSKCHAKCKNIKIMCNKRCPCDLFLFHNEQFKYYRNIKIVCNKRCPCDCKDHCPYTYSPVCGKDGKTHQSKCHAKCK